jgi:hypothetical protein
MSIGPVLSASWFPAHQRFTATAVCAVANYFGVGLGAYRPLLPLVGPFPGASTD